METSQFFLSKLCQFLLIKRLIISYHIISYLTKSVIFKHSPSSLMASSSSLMASSSSFMASSSSLCRTWRYNVFTSFHGPDVRQTFLSHLRKQFENNAITMFNDEKINRGEVITPVLRQAIKESRISIVVLSKQYASSSWCLDELLEITKCKEDLGQKVMTVFYGVEPSDVRKQNGEFGDAFKITCAKNPKEQRKKWRKALKKVGNIAGEVFKKCKNEAKMIEKIASDISNILTDTPPKEFDDKVGFEAHMTEMESRLEFDNNDVVKIVAITGPAGIGKTTIARAIYSRHSKKFHNDCFLDLRKSGSDKCALVELLLSKVLKQNDIKKCHLGSIQERLHDQKVFIILDDVQSLNSLDVLADIRWYGPGSRIIVTTENKEILQGHGINDIYHVSFPSEDEALKIFCLSAFRETSPPNGFLDLSNEVVRICGNLPLGLQVVGSSLRGKNLDAWALQLPSLKMSLDREIEDVLELGYKSLNEKDRVIFLCVAVLFNGEDEDYVTSTLDETNWNAKLGLENLANRYLIQKVGGRVEMHHLLQVMAMRINERQDFPKRQILVQPQEISYVLEFETGTGSVVGISFDTTEVNTLKISTNAFKRMFNLLFLKVYNDSWNFADFQSPELLRDYLFLEGYLGDKNAFDPKTEERLMRDLMVLKNYDDIKRVELQISEDMEFPNRLRLVHWEGYPRKSLPLGFCTKNLVKLDLRYSLLEKLWEGTQPLANLKEMYVNCSACLKELPDLSTASNLEILHMFGCSSLVEIPASVANLRTLKNLKMDHCENLEIIPTLANLTSLEGHININECPKLRTFPDFPTNKTFFFLRNTGVEELPTSLRHCSSLEYLEMSGSRNLRTFSTHLPTGIIELDLSYSGIESITDCIKSLPNLQDLRLSGCKRLVLLPEVPSSIQLLWADNCQLLKGGRVPLNTPSAYLQFTNCFKLDSQTRRAIIQQSYFPNRIRSIWGTLPGREVPEEFFHRTTQNSLTIPPSSFNRVKGCILISPKLLQDIFCLTSGDEYDHIFFDCKINGNLVRRMCIYRKNTIQAEHLLIFGSDFLSFDPSKVSTNIVLECRVPMDSYDEECKDYHLDIIEWGIQILTDEKDVSTPWDSGIDNMDTNESDEESGQEDNEEGSKSESGEASKDKDMCIADTSESVSRKRPREKTITSAATNLKRETKDDVFLQEMAIQETGECSSALESSSLTGITEGDDYEFVSRKRPRKTMITYVTTSLRRLSKDCFQRRKKSKLNNKSFQWLRSFRIALVLRKRRKPTPSKC